MEEILNATAESLPADVIRDLIAAVEELNDFWLDGLSDRVVERMCGPASHVQEVLKLNSYPSTTLARITAARALGQDTIQTDPSAKRQVKKLFEELDSDGSGSLDRGEITELLINLGHQLADGALDEAMALMDTDGGGEVEFEEFLVVSILSLSLLSAHTV